MDRLQSFRVGVRRKITYLTNLIFWIGGLFFLVLIIVDLVFYPIRNTPDEMQTAIFFWFVPELWKKIITLSFFGFFATSLLYGFLRFYKPAVLKFNTNEIAIRGKAFKLTIPIRKIKKIYCNDASTSRGESKNRFSVQIEQKRHRATTIKLKSYSDMDDFMEQLTKYENLEIKFYNFLHLLAHIDEE